MIRIGFGLRDKARVGCQGATAVLTAMPREVTHGCGRDLSMRSAVEGLRLEVHIHDIDGSSLRARWQGL